MDARKRPPFILEAHNPRRPRCFDEGHDEVLLDRRTTTPRGSAGRRVRIRIVGGGPRGGACRASATAAWASCVHRAARGVREDARGARRRRRRPPRSCASRRLGAEDFAHLNATEGLRVWRPDEAPRRRARRPRRRSCTDARRADRGRPERAVLHARDAHAGGDACQGVRARGRGPRRAGCAADICSSMSRSDRGTRWRAEGGESGGAEEEEEEEEEEGGGGWREGGGGREGEKRRRERGERPREATARSISRTTR